MNRLAGSPSHQTPNSCAPARLVSVFWTVFALVGVLMALWAVATPLMAVPDEPSHAIRAASVVRGQFSPGQSTLTPSQSAAEVPRYVADTDKEVCFKFHANVTANCHKPVDREPNQIVPASTTAAANGLAFYAVVGLPTLFLSGDAALYGMRIVSVLMSAALVAITFAAVRAMVPADRSPIWSYAGLTASLTPMALFLSGSINPNGVEYAAALTVLAVLTAVFRVRMTNRQLWASVITLLLAATLLLSTRSVSLLWLAIIVLMAVLMARWDVFLPLFRRAATWFAILTVGASSFFALFWYTRSLPTTGVPHTAVSFPDAFFYVLERTVYYAGGIVGLFGWMERPAPFEVFLVYGCAIAGVVLVALFRVRGRFLVAILLMAAIVFVTPGIVQGMLAPAAGIIWQGRYMLAMYACVLLVCGLCVDLQRPLKVRRWLQVVAILAISTAALAQLFAFVWVLQTYVVGAREPWQGMISHPAWQPPGTWQGLSLAFLAALIAAAFVLAHTVNRRPRADPLATPVPADQASEQALG